MTINHLSLRSPEDAACLEWVAANGAGAFASSTALGANTRRYHGLLMAALNPPLGRTLLVSKLEEELLLEGGPYSLSTNFYSGLVHPQGYLHLEQFRLDPLPVFRFRCQGRLIEKTAFMLRRRNTTCLIYRLLEGEPAPIRLVPLVNCRDYHHLTGDESLPFSSRLERDSPPLLAVELPGGPRLRLMVNQGGFEPGPAWYHQMIYPRERERGLDWQENHWSPGAFQADLGREPLAVILTAEETLPPDPLAEERQERERLKTLVPDRLEGDPLARALILAADSFLVSRDGGATVIAGYHWFGDWGRDSMIALPGLTLATGRFEEARAILLTWAKQIKGGLIPNLFLDGGGGADYHSVDAPLWMVNAAWKYYQYTGDRETLEELRPALRQIVQSYREGTDYGIKTDDDGLVSAVAPGTQLTWMDANIGDRVITARHGKPVEINALWYNALRAVAELAGKLGWGASGEDQLAEQVLASFRSKFWNQDEQRLDDLVGDSAFRPNQILAVSLPFPALEGEQARQVVRAVERFLYTPYGLRTLAPGSPGYRGRYRGGVLERDEAYHQGTAWAWLLGPFITAMVRAEGGSPQARARANRMLDPIRGHLGEAGLGSISEVFDGDPPHRPGGAISQAWSVAEVLRAYLEEVRSEKWEVRRKKTEDEA